MGRLRHRLCRRVFAAIGEKPFPQNPSEVFPAARRAMEEELRHWENRIPFGRTPFWTVVRRKMEADIMKLLKKESAEFPGFFVQEMEEEHRIPRPDEKLAYSGTIDRVSRLNETLRVVDYKSSFRYSQKSLISAQGEPFSFQMPLYILLLGEEADLVEKAEYYNFAEGKFVSFLKPGQEEVKQRLLTVLERKARAYAREIQSGQFCPPRDCDGCGFRALCRQKYFVRENP